MYSIDKEAKRLFEIYVNKKNNPMVLIGITNPNGRLIYQFGENYKPDILSENKVFEIGSVTKVFTGILLQTMINEQIVNLDDPIIKYKNSYINAFSSNGKEVTFRHLITHTSGLPRDAKNLKLKDRTNPYANYKIEDLDQFFTSYILKKEIDKKWRYSNVGVGFLGNLLSEILGTTYDKAIKERIFEPLGMTNSSVNWTPEQEKNMIKVIKKDKEIPPISLPAIEGSGAIRSNLSDMLTFLEANLGLCGSPLQNILNESHNVYSHLGPYKKSKMGLAWWITEEKDIDDQIIWHGGTTVGFHTYLGMVKSKKLGIVVCSTDRYSLWKFLMIIIGKQKMIAQDIGLDITRYMLHKEFN